MVYAGFLFIQDVHQTVKQSNLSKLNILNKQESCINHGQTTVKQSNLSKLNILNKQESCINQTVKQSNLSKLNILNTQESYINQTVKQSNLSKLNILNKQESWFMQDSCLFRIWFRHVSLFHCCLAMVYAGFLFIQDVQFRQV
jgi:hypothetical protein